MAERIMDEILISILEMNDPISHLHHLQDLKPTDSAKLNNTLSELGIQKLSARSIGESALQNSFPTQLQQKNEVHIDDRSKVPSVPSNEAKPLLPSLSTTSADVSIIPKNPGISTSSSTSDGFVLDK